MYLLVLREIYVCIKSTLLWYNIFSATLEDLGFEINPYGRGVANKVIEGTQCTITWYTEDNKLLHKNTDMISGIINEVRKNSGELSVGRGNKHAFLGNNIYIKYSTIPVDVVKQLEDCIEILVRTSVCQSHPCNNKIV